MTNNPQSLPSFYDRIRSTVYLLADRAPFESEGQVVNDPAWYEYPRAEYSAPAPLVTPSGIMSDDNIKLLIILLAFLLALALITRK